MNHETLNRLRASGLSGGASEEEKRTLDKLDAEHEAKQAATISRLVSQNFGIHEGEADGAFTAHPAMAGIIRRTLREAYDAGRNETARVMVEALLTRLADKHEQEKPHQWPK